MDAPRTILLVDDEAAIRTMLCQALQRNGFTMLEADSGPAAIELTRRESCPIDVLVSDVVMPGMNGIELARELCAERPGLRVVLISGYVDTPAPLEPGWQLLHKPFPPSVLAEKIRLICPAAIAASTVAEGEGESRQPGRDSLREMEETLHQEMRSAREEYVQASREYRRLIGFGADTPEADCSVLAGQAADSRKKRLAAYAASVSRLAEFMKRKAD
jgi:DNA-binding response OmpR family regulator